MHGSPPFAPPVQVFTQMDPGPNAAVHGAGPDGHATLPHVTSDGHGHGPPNGYAKPLTLSTTAAMSKALRSPFSSGKFG